MGVSGQSLATHLHTLFTAGGIAADLRGLGEFQRALEIDQERYDRFKDHYGEDYRATLLAANNLAVDLRLIGDSAQGARPRRGNTEP